MKKRYEVRTRICSTGQDIELIKSFFFRKNAEKLCFELNAMSLVFGAVGYMYYVHDTRDDA